VFEAMKIQAQIKEGAKKHIAADAAKQIKVKSLHFVHFEKS
jgi:hypothetical protein